MTKFNVHYTLTSDDDADFFSPEMMTVHAETPDEARAVVRNKVGKSTLINVNIRKTKVAG